MKFRDLDIPERLKDALEAQGFDEMYPHQAEAIPKALTGNNLVVTVPTAGGKSMIGFIPALKTVLTKHRKVLYIVPLKALASEKRDDLEKFSHLGFKVIQATGDPDRDDDVGDADIVVATSEKADSMARHSNSWIKKLGLVIADEVHMVHDPGRGPTLEVTLTKFMRNIHKLQVIALSATVSNSQDLALWLNAELVTSNFRPTALHDGVFLDDRIDFTNGDSLEVPPLGDPLWNMIHQTVSQGGQCLIFVNSRRSTESVAHKFASKMKKLTGAYVSPADALILEGGTESTAMGKKLAECVDSGIAFHHAGLDYNQRRCVEEGFRNRTIKCIVATPTLAAGINLPARRVIVRDTNRFESNVGNVPIPVMEIKQMCGRAGRPGLDPFGEAVLVAKGEEDKQHLFDDYLFADSERITSKLGNEIVLRGHMLGLISTDDVKTESDIGDFMEKTFYGATCDLYGMDMVISNVLDFLMDNDMVEMAGYFHIKKDLDEYIVENPEHPLVCEMIRTLQDLEIVSVRDKDLILEARNDYLSKYEKFRTAQEFIDMFTEHKLVFKSATTYRFPEHIQVSGFDSAARDATLRALANIGCLTYTKNLVTVPTRSNTVEIHGFFDEARKKLGNYKDTELADNIIEVVGREKFEKPGQQFVDAQDVIDVLLERELIVKDCDKYDIAKSGYGYASQPAFDSKLCRRMLDIMDEMGHVRVEKDVFYGIYKQDPIELRRFHSTIVHRVVRYLEEEGILERYYPDEFTTRDFRALNFGRRTSDLYVDPWTAVILRKAVLKMNEATDDLMVMQAISCTPDVMGLYPKKDDMDELESVDSEYDEKWLCNLKDECGGDDYTDAAWDNHLADLKTALLLVRWISEMSEEGLTETLKIGPGDIRSRVDNAEWILYAMNEVAMQYNPDASAKLKPLLVRVKYGVKEELNPLVSFKGVARTRARTLFNAGIRNRQDILDCDLTMLEGLPKIGKSLAKSLKEQAGYKRKSHDEEPPQIEFEDEDEYMIERMFAEEEAKNNPAPVDESKKYPKKDASAPKKKQISLDSFFS